MHLWTHAVCTHTGACTRRVDLCRKSYLFSKRARHTKRFSREFHFRPLMSYSDLKASKCHLARWPCLAAQCPIAVGKILVCSSLRGIEHDDLQQKMGQCTNHRRENRPILRFAVWSAPGYVRNTVHRAGARTPSTQEARRF
jgi:hypothetical protein